MIAGLILTNKLLSREANLTEISGVLRSNDRISDTQWFLQNCFTTDSQGNAPYDERQRREIRLVIERGWIPMDHVKCFDADQLRSIIGDDGFFSFLGEVDLAFQQGRNNQNFIMTPLVMGRVLEQGHAPREVFNVANQFLLAYTWRLGTIGTSKADLSPVTLSIAQSLKQGWDPAEIAAREWTERAKPHMPVYGIEPLPSRPTATRPIGVPVLG